jgi:hypothetical protein
MSGLVLFGVVFGLSALSFLAYKYIPVVKTYINNKKAKALTEAQALEAKVLADAARVKEAADRSVEEMKNKL